MSHTLQRIKPIAVLMAALLLFGGCAGPAATSSGEVTSAVNNGDAASLDDKTITDDPLYYANESPFTVDTMYLTVRKGNESDGTNHTWSEVNAYSTFFYDDNNIDRYKVEGTLQVGDETGPLPDQLGYGAISPNATVQIRGKSTSRSEQKSYQIKLKDGKGEWKEQRTIILNKHVFDPSRFRNKMTYDLMIQHPELFGAKTTFVHLYVKDMTAGGTGQFVDYGLFTQVEQFNKRYMLNHGLDQNGQFYKASMFEFLMYDDLKLTTDKDYDVKAFEQVLEIKGDDDHTKLIQMLQDINNYAVPIEESFTKWFDEDNYFSWLAFQLIIGNTDIVSQNFFLYSPLNGNKWYFIPWDNDGAWGYQSRYNNTYEPGYNYMEGLSNLWGATLHQRVLKSVKLRQKLLDKIEYFHNELSPQKLDPLFKKYADVVYPYLFRMPDINYSSLKKDAYYSYVKSMAGEIEYNYQMILESLKRPMPFYFNDPEASGNNLIFVWDNSYDFKGETLSYTLQVARDYNFKKIVFELKNSVMPQAECKMLPDGQYFMKITVTNASGKTQTMQQYYEDVNGLKHYGVSAFFIEKGKVIGGQNG